MTMGGFCCSLLIISVAFLTPGPVAAEIDWKTCGNYLSKECGEAIRLWVALNQGPPPPIDCCPALLKIGKPCHDAFTQV